MTNDNRIILNYKYRIYPNATQQRQLENMLEVSRQVYNRMVGEAEADYRQNGKRLHWMEQTRLFLAARRQSEIWKAIPSTTVKSLSRQLAYAYDAYFKRMKQFPGEPDRWGKPRPQPAQKWESFVWDASGAKPISQEKPKLKTSFWSGGLRVQMDRPFPDDARIRQIRIMRNHGKWYVVFALDCMPRFNFDQQGAVGIDVGIARWLTLSNGGFIPPQSYYTKLMPELRRIQRKLDRQRRANNPDCYNDDGTAKKGKRPGKKSREMRKTERKLAKVSEAIKERRWYFWHTVTDWLTRTYAIIAIEDLSPQFMIGNKRLAKLATDAAFATFQTMLMAKADERGVQVIKVTPAYTSQTCNQCGHVMRENRLTQAQFKCVSCGHEDHADVNAAKNILDIALNGAVRVPGALTENVGSNVAPEAQTSETVATGSAR